MVGKYFLIILVWISSIMDIVSNRERHAHDVSMYCDLYFTSLRSTTHVSYSHTHSRLTSLDVTSILSVLYICGFFSQPSSSARCYIYGTDLYSM